MKIQPLLNDDDAVSPVIGVILMVAITVILAAVIATFVLGLGEQVSSTAPQASFSWDYESDDSDLRITHDGGDGIQKTNLYIRGTGAASGTDASMTSTGQWEGSASGKVDGSSAVTAGDSVIIGADNDYELSVVYQSSEGSSSATLSQDSGPQS